MTLPNLSSDQIAALAGQAPNGLWSRLSLGWATLAGLAVVIVGGLGLALGRRFRRPPVGPAPAPAA